MNAHPKPGLADSKRINRRPRIALMGEFSAGKSTLANLLLGEDVSPVKVTATQLPPVWYSHGPTALIRVDRSGAETVIAADALGTLTHRDTQAVRVSLEADVLEFCDVVDMPGTSDPNMPPAVWESMLARCDGVVWCTPATQAWRQSEAAVWESLPAAFHGNSLLLVTRIDMMQSRADRDRVLSRVRREAGGLFAHVLPIALTEAIAGKDMPEVLERSGAEALVERLIEMVEGFGTLPADPGPGPASGIDAAAAPDSGAASPAVGTEAPAVPDGTIVPRRVISRRKTGGRPRP